MIESTLAAFVTSFREIHPAVEVQLVEEGGNNLPGRLERGRILLALMALISQAATAALDFGLPEA